MYPPRQDEVEAMTKIGLANIYEGITKDIYMVKWTSIGNWQQHYVSDLKWEGVDLHC